MKGMKLEKVRRDAPYVTGRDSTALHARPATRCGHGTRRRVTTVIRAQSNSLEAGRSCEIVKSTAEQAQQWHPA